MINCRNCINWVDENLVQIEADHGEHQHIFMGCRIYGYVENNTALESCPHFMQSENLFTICGTCNAGLVTVTVTPGKAAPVSSLTVPAIDPLRTCCPNTAELKQSSATAAQRIGLRLSRPIFPSVRSLQSRPRGRKR